MATNIHVIQRQYLHAELNGTESDTWVLQNRLSGWFCDDLLPALEKIFNRVSESESWSIDRLDIDAGVLTLEHWEQDLTAIVAEAIEKRLREQLSRSPAASTNNIRHKTNQQSLAEALIYFLNTGRLPWSITLTKNKNFEHTLLDAWQNSVETIPVGLILGALRSIPARKRLVRQFSPLFMSILLERLSPESQKVIVAILVLLQNSDAPSVGVKQFEQQLWETVFTFIATGKTVTENAVIAEAWQALTVKTPALENLLARHWSAAITNTHSPKLKPLSSAPIIQPSDSTNKLTIDHEQENLPMTDSVKPFKQTDTNKSLDLQEKPPTTKTVFQAADIQEGIYIENAGLILLHPFLPQFFTALGIANEDQLIQHERALCLLHFLTTGLLIAPEYELTLAKILCNIPLEMPVESDMELSESEREEAEALLNAVIHHWDALRNTSIDGLRGEFLLRFGKLSMRDGDWLLQVEAKTVDILLNQLPWGISMIKLPWMQRMLWVEWDY
ncbi:MAG: hypothetical protein RIR39_1502 [Pseudomonadota bacterium]